MTTRLDQFKIQFYSNLMFMEKHLEMEELPPVKKPETIHFFLLFILSELSEVGDSIALYHYFSENNTIHITNDDIQDYLKYKADNNHLTLDELRYKMSEFNENECNKIIESLKSFKDCQSLLNAIYPQTKNYIQTNNNQCKFEYKSTIEQLVQIVETHYQNKNWNKELIITDLKSNCELQLNLLDKKIYPEINS